MDFSASCLVSESMILWQHWRNSRGADSARRTPQGKFLPSLALPLSWTSTAILPRSQFQQFGVAKMQQILNVNNWALYVHRVRKKRDQHVFCNISYKTRAIMMKFGIVSWINLLQRDVSVFHLTWIMSLHYLVKLEMLIARVLQLHC